MIPVISSIILDPYPVPQETKNFGAWDNEPALPSQGLSISRTHTKTRDVAKPPATRL